MHLRTIVIAGLALSLVVPAAADTIDVYVFSYDFSMDPTHAQITDPVIQVGDTIRWNWQNQFHDVKSVEGQAEQFYSGFPTNGLPFTFEHTFTNEGTFWYYCTPHGEDLGNGTAVGMAGTVTVQAVPEPGTMAALGLGVLAFARRRSLRRKP